MKSLNGQIRNLILQNIPIREMSRRLDVPLSTVHYHVRKIKPGFRSLERPKINFRNLEEFGEVLGIFSGDGSVTGNYYYDTVITIGKKEGLYLKELIKLLIKVFNKRPWVYHDVNESVFRVRYRSILIFNFFIENLKWVHKKTKNVHLKRRIKNKRFGIGFLRGLIDTDGWITNKRVIFNTISKNLKKDIEFYLRLLNIDFRTRLQKDKRINQSDIYRIEILPHRVSKFFAIIKPRKFGVVV